MGIRKVIARTGNRTDAVGAWIPQGESSLYAIYVEKSQGVVIGHYADEKESVSCDVAFSVLPDGKINVQYVIDGEIVIKEIPAEVATLILQQFFKLVKDAAQ